MTNIVMEGGAFINNLSDVALHPYHYCSSAKEIIDTRGEEGNLEMNTDSPSNLNRPEIRETQDLRLSKSLPPYLYQYHLVEFLNP
ncbi:MAG: hypothetical protein ACI8RA_002141, partial [Chlamydiales bacterium]